MYLVDTNVWMEVILDRANAKKAQAFLAAKKGLHVSSLTLDSLGIMLEKEGRMRAFQDLLENVTNGLVAYVTLSPPQLSLLPEAMKRLGVDYEDAYQLACAVKAGARLVTQDKKLLKLAGVVALEKVS